MGNEHKECLNTGSTGILPVHSTNRQDACSPSDGAHSGSTNAGSTGILPVHSTNRQDACSPSGKTPSEEATCYMRPYDDIDMHARNLPHWSQDNVLAFVTWRLADSLPQAKLQEIEEAQKTFLSGHPKPWDEATMQLYRKNVSQEMEAFLDSGCGSCVLQDERVRQEVEDALQFFNRKRYNLHAFVVMPNHVHVLFEIFTGFPQNNVLHTWKSFTANVVNKALGRQGRLWQDESWDRLIRNDAHYRNCLAYIRDNNPRLARIFVERTGSTAYHVCAHSEQAGCLFPQ
jgi:REP element-mobilizing transposase RayT